MTAALALLRRFWWAIPIAVLAVLLWVRTDQRDDVEQTLANERQAWTATLDRAERVKAAAERRYAEQQTAAALTYADRLAAREPIILRSTNTVREYAQTDAGRVLCRGADRVRAIDALDAELARGAGPNTGGAGPVQPDPAAPPG